MNLELVLSFEGLAALRTCHFERGFKLDVLVSVHFHLFLVVHTVLFLSDLVFWCLPMPLEQLFAHETLNAGTALESPLAVTESVIGAKRAATLGVLEVCACGFGRTSGRFPLFLQCFSGFLHDAVNFTQAVTIAIVRCLFFTAFGLLFFRLLL